MPHQVVTAPGHDRRRSVGWLALAWIEYFVVHGPGDVQGQPVRHGDEFSRFIVDCYAVDEHARRMHDAAFLSRPKGCDKSGIGGRIALFEALGPCRGTGEFAEGGEVYRDPWGLGFEYVYEPGEPLARPVRVPFLRCMATEEDQTGAVYDTILFNLQDEDSPLSGVLDHKDDAGLSRVLLPGGGEIIPSTAAAASKDGGKETWTCYDETHLYVTPELRRMYATVNRNLRKRKKIAETWYLETTTMYRPGQGSVAEATYGVAEKIRAGKARGRSRQLLDHRWGDLDLDSLGNEAKVREALADAYGDAVAWNDLDGLVDEFFDERATLADSMRYFLNSRTAAKDAWLSEPEWRARHVSSFDTPPPPVTAGDTITLGFDGSRGRARGKPDATALIGCRVSDGHLFELGVWEAGDGEPWDDWSPPLAAIEAAISDAFKHYKVAAFYADPGRDWRSHVNAWEAKHGAKVMVKARRDHPFEWWMTGGRSGLVQLAIEGMEGAVRNGDLTHEGATLTQHVLNAHRRFSRGKLALGKETDYSPHKIDAAVAAVLAWQARIDAVAAGAGRTRKRSTRKPKRLR